MTVIETQTQCGFSLADLEAMPDDGRRYELIGGSIIVTPPPDIAHQRSSHRFQRVLQDAAGPQYEVFNAPIGFSLPTGDELEPDLIVVDVARVGKRLTLPALLVVELVSPGSARHDTVTKLDAYARAGVRDYWIVDTREKHHSFTAYRLGDAGRYEVMASSTERIDITDPVVVDVALADLFSPRPRR